MNFPVQVDSKCNQGWTVMDRLCLMPSDPKTRKKVCRPLLFNSGCLNSQDFVPVIDLRSWEVGKPRWCAVLAAHKRVESAAKVENIGLNP